MIENNCKLQDFHMIVLEEVNNEYLDKKEQQYFHELSPSFFGFNQFNSFLMSLKLRFSKSQITDLDIYNYLIELQKDINFIYSCYDYGFTKFNLEHSMPRNITYLTENKYQLKDKTLLKYNEVQLNLQSLYKKYNLYFEVEKNKLLSDTSKKLFDDYTVIKDKYEIILNSQKDNLLYKTKTFINKIFNNKNDIDKLLLEKDHKWKDYQDSSNLVRKNEKKLRNKRYKMIFPIFEFSPFPLANYPRKIEIQINKDNDIPNTLTMNIYISNNGINRSDTIYKKPYIIAIDYLFIDKKGNKTKNIYYIANETTKNCKSSIKYIEKNYYDQFAIKKQRFQISSIIDNQMDNSFISILSEYKHGINDSTLKNKKLIKLNKVIDEIEQITDEDTGFKISVSESYNCLEKCIINENLQNNLFIKKLLKNKLHSIKKTKTNQKLSMPKSKKDIYEMKEINKKKKIDAYKEKVNDRSNGEIIVSDYTSSREKVSARCGKCGYEWKLRSDHLLARAYCPICNKNNN